MVDWIPDIAAVDDIAPPLGITGGLDYYNIYRGQDGDIDFNTPVAVMLEGDTRVNIANQDLPAGTIWHYVRKKAAACCGKESIASPLCIVVIDGSGEMIGLTPNSPILLEVQQLFGGAFGVRWTYYTDDQEVQPTGFNIYADSGLGWALAAQLDYRRGQTRWLWDSPVYAHGSVVKWLVKSFYTSGGESNNAAFAAAIADAEGPNTQIAMMASFEEF